MGLRLSVTEERKGRVYISRVAQCSMQADWSTRPYNDEVSYFTIGSEVRS